MIRIFVIFMSILFSTQVCAEVMSDLIQGDGRTVICNIKDTNENKLTYIFENPLNHILSEINIRKNQTFKTHEIKERPVWLTDYVRTPEGDLFVLSYVKDFDYKILMNNVPAKYDEEERFPISNAQLWKKNVGLLASGTCHVVIQ